MIDKDSCSCSKFKRVMSHESQSLRFKKDDSSAYESKQTIDLSKCRLLNARFLLKSYSINWQLFHCDSKDTVWNNISNTRWNHQNWKTLKSHESIATVSCRSVIDERWRCERWCTDILMTVTATTFIFSLTRTVATLSLILIKIEFRIVIFRRSIKISWVFIHARKLAEKTSSQK